jgi:hypothetical protein
MSKNAAVVSALLAMVLTTGLGTVAQTSAAAQGSATSSSGSKSRQPRRRSAARSVSSQLQEMKQALDAQQQQIQELRQELQTRDQSIQQLQQQVTQTQSSVSQAQSKADQAAQANQQQQSDVTAVKSDVDNLKTNVANTATSLQEEQKARGKLESPLAIHYKGITITPGGFLTAETVWRQRGLSADVNSPFNSIPYPSGTASTEHNLSEFFASGRQSRVSMLAEGKLNTAKLTGYVEADFLSAAITSNNNQSNSYSLRQRQVWGQAALENGLSFTGGQMWSLVTETKKGVDNRTEALPMTIDAQYTVGFTWARQYGFRISKNFNNKMWLAFSVEEPQTTFTAHGNSANFLLGAPGTSGGLFNPTANYSFNKAPDLIAKAVFEPGFGHYEIFGVLNQFHDRVFPCAGASSSHPCGGLTTPSAANAFNDSRTGGGVGANVRFTVHKHVDFGGHGFAGNGVGRYGTGGLPEATVRPAGTLALIRSYQALGTLEFHTTKWDWYFNGGGEYAGRTSYLNSTGKGVGYGSPLFVNAGCFTEVAPGGSNGFTPGVASSTTPCTGDARNLIEGTAGFWYRFYNGPKGKVQWGPQYSYIVRNSWSGLHGLQPYGNENMVFTSFRYYLP